MRGRHLVLAMCMSLLPLDALSQSLVPRLRPGDAAEAATPSPVPRTRPADVMPAQPAPAPAASAPRRSTPPVVFVTPRLRPNRLAGQNTAAPAAAAASTVAVGTPPAAERTERGGLLRLFQNPRLRRTSVCGDIDIQGEAIGEVTSSRRGCGIKEAVRIKSVSGINLSTPAVLNCNAARALNSWVKDSAIPASRRMGQLNEIRVAASYVCKTRNSQPGARLSEHSFGNAIDISAFRMRNGRTITLLEGWSGGDTRRMLVSMWEGACGPFGTVLGPSSNRFHRGHFHFDVASYRSGPFCR